MKAKPVYLNDRPVGEAATWSDVRILVAEKGLPFEGLADATEGPSGFFLYGGAQTIGSESGTETPPAAVSTANSGSERAKAIA